jgi:hypothetical protein
MAFCVISAVFMENGWKYRFNQEGFVGLVYKRMPVVSTVPRSPLMECGVQIGFLIGASLDAS